MTVTTQQERKDLIVPGKKYHVTYEWVLDKATLVPINVRVVYTPC